MTVGLVAAFTAGVGVGWVGRSVMGSGRELVVRGVTLAHEARTYARRFAAEQIEWVEDAFAEGRARYDVQHGSAPVDEAAQARVGEPRRGRAA